MPPYKLIILLLFFNYIGASQTDTHYWTNQYGAKGLLLNGAVIASPEDETSLFYNPGAIGQDDQLGFSFSFLTPTFSNLRTNDFLGENTTLNDNGLGLSPGFLAVRFKPFKNHKFTAGIASFQRHKSSISYKDRLVGISSTNESDLFRGDFSFGRKLSENWYGFGLSYSISDKFGIGFSQYSAWHDEELKLNYKKEIVNRDRPQEVILSLRNDTEYHYSINSSFLTKLGIAYTGDRFKFGLTFTSPSYGKLRASASYASDDQTVYATDSTIVHANRNKVTVRDYKTPYSIGFGAEVILDKVHVSFSTEYFGSINQYFIFTDADDPFDGLSDPDSDAVFGVSQGNHSVINFALGFQRRINKSKTWLWGVRTDFNQRNNFKITDNLEYLASTPDVIHFSGGGTFRFGKNIFSMGLDYGYGYRFGGLSLTDLSDITRDNIFTFNQSENVENRFHSIMLFLTYDFIFSGMNSL